MAEYLNRTARENTMQATGTKCMLEILWQVKRNYCLKNRHQSLLGSLAEKDSYIRHTIAVYECYFEESNDKQLMHFSFIIQL